MTLCNTCRQRHRSDIAPHSYIAMTSWISGSISGALETAAQQWGLSPDQNFVWSDIFITADRHPRLCDISSMHFRIFFIKTPIRVWLKASETSFPRKRMPCAHFVWFWKGLHIFFLQIVVFVWRINSCRVYNNKFYYTSYCLELGQNADLGGFPT
jgi:hypothetical protein